LPEEIVKYRTLPHKLQQLQALKRELGRFVFTGSIELLSIENENATVLENIRSRRQDLEGIYRRLGSVANHIDSVMAYLRVSQG